MNKHLNLDLRLVRSYGELELEMNSVERVNELCEIEQEPEVKIEKTQPPAWWPSDSGNLVVDNLVIKYSKELEPVLRNISFTVNAKEKVGIVGR
jgi:ABC-type multidrug transport system fused ATPase/permease subunit